MVIHRALSVSREATLFHSHGPLWGRTGDAEHRRVLWSVPTQEHRNEKR